MGTPQWLDGTFTRDNANPKWMISRGTPIFGNTHMVVCILKDLRLQTTCTDPHQKKRILDTLNHVLHMMASVFESYFSWPSAGLLWAPSSGPRVMCVISGESD